jgi:hypothetical protein
MGAGMAIGMVGGALQNAGFEKGGEAVSDFGGALMGLGTAASALSPILATLGLSAGWLTAIIVGISAVYAGAKYMI